MDRALINILYVNSYLPEINFISNPIDALAEHLLDDFDDEIKFKNLELQDYINNVLIKLGHLEFAKKSIGDVNGVILNPGTNVTYHLAHFIYSTKAFLDSLAILVNYVFELGYEKGDIDFKKGRFKKSLINENKNFEVTLQEYDSWISKVIEWRDSLIHQKISLIIPASDGKPDYDPFKHVVPVKMPIEPMSLNDFKSKITKIKNKNGGKFMQEIMPFCNAWIENSTKLMEDIVEVILKSKF